MVSEATVLQIIERAREKANEFFDEISAELVNEGREEPDAGSLQSTGTDSVVEPKEKWILDEEPVTFKWMQTDEPEGESYRWPDGNVDEYVKFMSFKGGPPLSSGAHSSEMELGVGFLESGDVVGFVLSNDGAAKRGIAYFQRTDDFEHSGELISMIRGGGKRGRSGFSPNDPAPPAYAEFDLESLRDRKEGKWNVLGVTANPSEPDGLGVVLDHTALQARLRGLA